MSSILQEIKKCNTNKNYIFVSYSSCDSDIVWKDVLEFQKRGYNVWLDEKNLDKQNDSWKDDAIDAIEDMDCGLVVFYVSKTSLTSRACLNEMRATKSDEAKKYHQSEVKFIAVDVDEINNIIEFQKNIFNEIKEDKKLEKPEKKEYMDTLDSFIKEFFNSNNERVRIRPNVPNRKRPYYEEILEYFPNGAFEPNQEVVSPIIEETTSALVNTVVSDPDVGKNDIPDQSVDNTQIGHEKLEIEDVSTKTAKKSSSTGDITYTLYNEKYTENQSDMMLRFFAQVLKRHPEYVAELPEYKGMNCASKIDYTNPQNRTDDMPSYFRVCRYFTYEGNQSVCIGTAYSIGDKLKKMAALLQIVGEDTSVFSSEQIELPMVKTKSEKGAVQSGKQGSQIAFSVYGQDYEANQSDMLGIIMHKVIEKHPDKLQKIAENLLCVDVIDYTEVSKEDRPCYFKSSLNVYEVNGTKYSVGGGFSMKDKIKMIGKLMSICEESEGCIVIDKNAVEVSASKPKEKKKEKNFL